MTTHATTDAVRRTGQAGAPLGRYGHVAAEPRAARVPRSRAAITAVALVVLLVVAVVASMLLGQFSMSPAEVAGSFARRVGALLGGAPDASAARTDGALWNVRLPRIAAALVVGAALATAGAITQGLFGNPLAEPGVIGITSGAAVGAATAIIASSAAVVAWTVPAAAFASGILTTLLVLALSSRLGGSATLVLVLVGIAVNAVAGAASALMIFLAETTSREAIVFWQMGSLNGTTWAGLAPAAVVVALGLLVAQPLAHGLDALALGETDARRSGLDLRAFRAVAVLCAALLAAGAVAIGGIIGFVGLIVPHVLRLVVGPRQRVVLPLSAAAGALLLVGADLGARTLVPFVDLPIGVLTAVVGGPLFLVLVRARLRTAVPA
ncbi:MULTISPECIES: FecCD family ABC transporter permease [unclassified Agrococcus]|uniref:FecCD family ABC transporter permease n=1 Tax=unclassified Agrococcus TaxID=2615065 RepID=UPI003608B5EC